MAKNKYVLLGMEMGAAAVVMKELASYEGDYLTLDHGFVTIGADDARGGTVAVIHLAEGQSVKRKE
jgi:hypothetical protein